MAQQVCVVLSTTERVQLAAIAADRNGPRKRIARGAADGAKHRRQPAGGVAVAAALRRDGVEGLRRDKTRQNTDRRGSNGAGGDADLHRAAAPGDPLDRLGERSLAVINRYYHLGVALEDNLNL
jgi:hypothetical protein